VTALLNAEQIGMILVSGFEVSEIKVGNGESVLNDNGERDGLS
jgi:hypothetical protein